MAHKENLQEAAQVRIASLVDGNGVRGRSVTVQACEAYDVELTGHLEVTVLAKSDTRRYVGPEPPGSEMCRDIVDFNRRIREIEHNAASDAETITDLVAKINEIPGNGWGISRTMISLGRPIRRFCYYEQCRSCQGSAQAICLTCHGSGQQKCVNCHGTGDEICAACGGKPIMGPNGPQLCQQCHGSGLQKCHLCHGGGSGPCQNCQTRGKIPCPECQATGKITVATKIDLSAQAIFVIDPASVPEPLRPVFQNIGYDVLAKPGIAASIELAPHRIAEGQLRLPLRAQLSWAKVELQIAKRKLNVIVYGEKPVLAPIPPILDRLIQPGIDLLAKTIGNPGQAIPLIRQATGYRLIRFACQWFIKNPRLMIDEVLRLYPDGVSREKLQEIHDYFRLSFQGITRKPRLQALWACLTVNGVLAFANVFFGGRELFADRVHHPMAPMMVDAGLPILGMVISGIIVAFVAKRALKFALPGLFIGSGPKMADTNANQLGQVLLADEEDVAPTNVYTPVGRDLAIYLMLIPFFHLMALQMGTMFLHEAPPWYVQVTHQVKHIEEKPPKRVGRDPVGIMEWNLSRLGFDPGYIDGKIDRKAQIAIARLERAAGKPITGKPTEANQQLAMVAIEDHIFLDYGTNPMALGPALPNRVRGKIDARDLQLGSAALMSAIKSIDVPISWINEINHHSGDITVREADDQTGCIDLRHRIYLDGQTYAGNQKACWVEKEKKWNFFPE